MISPEILRRYPYFAGVTEESLKAVAAISEERSAKAGEVLWREDQPATHLFIVTQGEVDVRYPTRSGEYETVETIVAGDMMVWSAVVEPHRTHSLGVVRKDVSMVAVEAGKLRELMAADPTLGYHLSQQVARVIASRLQGARVQLATLN